MMPKNVRVWLEREIRDRNFTGYIDLADSVNTRLEEAGYEVRISKSGLHRWGQKLEQRIQAIRSTTEAAIQIRELAGDDEGALTDSLTRLLQDKLFQMVIDLEVDMEKADIYKLGKVIAELGKASVAQKRWMSDYRGRIDKKLEELERNPPDGFDRQTVSRVREEIYGVAP